MTDETKPLTIKQLISGVHKSEAESWALAAATRKKSMSAWAREILNQAATETIAAFRKGDKS